MEDECYLYIYRYDKKVYKIGISIHPLERIKSYIRESDNFDFDDEKNKVFGGSNDNIVHIEKQIKNIFSNETYRCNDNEYKDRDGKSELFYVEHIDTIILYITLTHGDTLKLTEIKHPPIDEKEIKKISYKVGSDRDEIFMNIMAFKTMTDLFIKIFNVDPKSITIESKYSGSYVFGLPISENDYVREVFMCRKTSIVWKGRYSNMMSCHYIKDNRCYVGIILRHTDLFEDLRFVNQHGTYLEKWRCTINSIIISHQEKCMANERLIVGGS